MPRERALKLVASNRKAHHDYHILDVFEAGIVLTGTEVKSLRAGRAALADGYASIEKGEAWLENVHIPEFFAGSWTNHATRRRRKLLLKRVEISKLGGKVRESGLTIVPLSIYFKDGKVKVEIALAQGKRDWDKRQALRAQQDKRETARLMSGVSRDPTSG